MSGKYGTSNAGAESVGVSDCNKVYKDAGNEAVHVLSPVERLDSMMLSLECWGTWYGMEFDSKDQAKASDFKALKEIFLKFKDVPHDFIPDEKSLHRVIESFIVSYRNQTYRIIATEFAYWAPNIESIEVNSESNPLERKDAEGPSLDESLEMRSIMDSR
ncbi:hypothetical protein Tco_1419173 [Tanacetum coccineum]